MKVRLSLDFHFSAAVRLKHQSGPAKHTHGHNYRLQVTLDGEADEAEVRQTVHEVALDKCDHQLLNDLIENPTSANVAKWFFAQLRNEVDGLYEVALWQTDGHCVRVSL